MNNGTIPDYFLAEPKLPTAHALLRLAGRNLRQFYDDPATVTEEMECIESVFQAINKPKEAYKMNAHERNFRKRVTALQPVQTGGGCDALSADLEDGGLILVTRVDDPSIPKEDEPHKLGIYGPQSDGIPLVAVIFANRQLVNEYLETLQHRYFYNSHKEAIATLKLFTPDIGRC